MPYAGKIIEDPITKQRITFLKTARDTGGELLRFEMRMAPSTFIPKHMHPMQHERVDVVSGIVRVRIRGRERSLASGQTLVVDPKEAHEVHNESDEDAVLVIEVRPALKTERMLETLFGLAREGMTDHEGRPKSALQLGMIAVEYVHEATLPGIPIFLHRAVMVPFAAFGRLFGYRPDFSRYVDDDEAL